MRPRVFRRLRYCASDFHTQKVFKTRRNARLCSGLGAAQTQRFAVDFGVVFPPGGTVPPIFTAKMCIRDRRERAGLGPAAAHCAELRSFRRGWGAGRSHEDDVGVQLSTTERLF